MSSVELDWVNEPIGHTQDVRQQWYQQESLTIEITKIAKLLIAKDNNDSFKKEKITEIISALIPLFSLFFNLLFLKYLVRRNNHFSS